MVLGPARPPDPCALRPRSRAAQISSGELPRQPACNADLPTPLVAAAKWPLRRFSFLSNPAAPRAR